MNLKSRVAGLMLFSVVALGLGASKALARPSIVLDSGQTRLSLSDDFVSALGLWGSLPVLSETALCGERSPGLRLSAAFWTCRMRKGQINHSGGRGAPSVTTESAGHPLYTLSS